MRDEDEQDQQAEVAAADEQVAAALAAGLDHPQEDGVAGEQTPEVVGDAEHGGKSEVRNQKLESSSNDRSSKLEMGRSGTGIVSAAAGD